MVHARLITAVACYGTKTGALEKVLRDVQEILGDRLGDRFRPYTLDQVHSTVIRLDGTADRDTGQIVNQRYLELARTRRVMDHARALEILTASLTPPLHIRIGGYSPGTPATFSSRGQHPYERMFSLQGNAFVLIGWPVSLGPDAGSPALLDELRRKMSEANIGHWYHDSPSDVDNDFHLVVGHLLGAAHQVEDTVRAVRGYLARHPVQIDVGVGQVAIIAANSPTLAPAEFVGRLPVDPADIVRLYQ